MQQNRHSEGSMKRHDDGSSIDEKRQSNDTIYTLSSSTAYNSSGRSSMASSVGSMMDHNSQTDVDLHQSPLSSGANDILPTESIISQVNSQCSQVTSHDPSCKAGNSVFSFSQLASPASTKSNMPQKPIELQMLSKLRGKNAVHPLGSPTEGEGQGDAPQIRIIRPSTDTLKHAVNSPSRTAQIKLGSMKLKNWTPMSTIVSTSESEFDMFGGMETDVYSESTQFSPVSFEQMQSRSPSNIVNVRWARRRSALMSQRKTHYRMSSAFSRQFSLASIWSDIHTHRNTRNVSNKPEVTGSFVFKRSLIIVGTFLCTQLPVALFHVCMYALNPDLLVNVYPLLKLMQQVCYAINPYLYVFSNQKIHKDLIKQCARVR